MGTVSEREAAKERQKKQVARETGLRDLKADRVALERAEIEVVTLKARIAEREKALGIRRPRPSTVPAPVPVPGA